MKLTRIFYGLLALVLTASCSRQEEPQPAPVPEPAPGGLYVRLHARMARSPQSRAAGEGVTPGTEAEERIHNFYLLVFDEQGDYPLWYGPVRGFENGEALQRIDGVYPGRTYRFYGIANLTARQFETILSTHSPLEYVLRCGAGHYTEVIHALVPGSHGEATAASQGIMMSSEKTEKTLEITDQEQGTRESPIKVEIALQRTVAKVHLLGVIDPTATGDRKYLRTYGGGGGSNSTDGMGYIQLQHVHYCLNGTNRSIYPFPHGTAAEGYSDPNMDMNVYEWDGDDFNSGLCTQDFVYYTQHSLAQLDPARIEANTQEGFRFHPMDEWNESRYEATVANTPGELRYTHGLYTPENLFTVPENTDVFDRYTDNPLPMVSSVVVAARLAPRLVITTAKFVENIDADHDEYLKQQQADPTAAPYKGYTDADWTRWAEIRERYEWTTACPWDKLSGGGFYEVNFGTVKAGQPNVTDYQKETDIRTALTLALKQAGRYSASGYDVANYPLGSFFTYYDEAHGTHRYMTCGVALSDALQDDRHLILPHVGGWGYYYTYIDPDGSNNPHAYKGSQVQRNYYYLLTVTRILTPGSTVTSNDYIRVNTTRLEWRYAGKGTIDLE